MNSYNVCAKKHMDKIKKNQRMPHLEGLLCWLISDLLCLSRRLRIRYITEAHTLNAALDMIKKYKVSKSDWRKKNRLLTLDSQVITLHL